VARVWLDYSIQLLPVASDIMVQATTVDRHTANKMHVIRRNGRNSCVCWEILIDEEHTADEISFHRWPLSLGKGSRWAVQPNRSIKGSVPGVLFMGVLDFG
jgi:hypothetical protein